MCRLRLSEMIVGLRQELEEAQLKAAKENLKFKVDAIDVEAQVTVTSEGSADGTLKWKFFVFSEAEGSLSGKVARESIHKISLKLTPEQQSGETVKIAR